MLMADGDDIINSADDAATAAVDDRAEVIDGIIIIIWCYLKSSSGGIDRQLQLNSSGPRCMTFLFKYLP